MDGNGMRMFRLFSTLAMQDMQSCILLQAVYPKFTISFYLEQNILSFINILNAQ